MHNNTQNLKEHYADVADDNLEIAQTTLQVLYISAEVVCKPNACNHATTQTHAAMEKTLSKSTVLLLCSHMAAPEYTSPQVM